MVSQAFWRSLRRNKIGHDLNPFSTSQKIVSSLSQGQGIFENCGLRGQGLQIVSSRTPPQVIISQVINYFGLHPNYC